MISPLRVKGREIGSKGSQRHRTHTRQDNTHWNCSALHTLQLQSKVGLLPLAYLRSPLESIPFPYASFFISPRNFQPTTLLSSLLWAPAPNLAFR